jgi:hypothetical protein
VPEDEAELKKMTKIQRAIERLNQEIDTTAVRQRGAVAFEEDSDSSVNPPAAAIAGRQDRFGSRSLSMDPVRTVSRDERLENLRKRMQIERLEKGEESDSDLFENQSTLDLIKSNFEKTEFKSTSGLTRVMSAERDLAEDADMLGSREESPNRRPAVMSTEEVQLLR